MSKRPPRRGATLAKAIIEEYQPKSVEDMQNALKEIFGPMFEAMLNGEMENHLGYMSNERSEKDTANRRNGYTQKVLKTSAGEVPISVPRDRDGSFTPQIVPKRQTVCLTSCMNGKIDRSRHFIHLSSLTVSMFQCAVTKAYLIKRYM